MSGIFSFFYLLEVYFVVSGRDAKKLYSKIASETALTEKSAVEKLSTFFNDRNLFFEKLAVTKFIEITENQFIESQYPEMNDLLNLNKE